jgi:two-component system, cell cycle response regulator
MKKKFRVLIVDDDRFIRTAVKRILEKSGNNYIVDELSDNSFLIKTLKEKKYDCIIVDYFLSGVTGLDIINELVSLKIEIPVIMITGQGDELTAVKVMKAGAYDYLPKSILSHNDASEILSYTIQNAINIYNSRIEKARTAISLFKSEERYRSLVEHSPMLIIRFFPDDFMISFVNDGFCDYFNTQRADIIGEIVSQYIFDDNDEKAVIILNLTKENPVANFEHCSETDNGIRWQLWTIQAFFGKDDRILEYQCIGEDITPLKKAEDEVYKQKVYFQSILDSQENIIIVTDKNEILEANLSFLMFFGYRNLSEFKKEHSDVVELSLDIPDYITGKDKSGWIDSILKGTCPQKLISFQPEGSPRASVFSVNISMLSVESELYVVTFSDVTELEHKSRNFEQKASIDALTGIFNKNKFNEILAANMDVSERYGTDLSIIFFDIDHFKKINDTYGHQAGDYVLKEVSSIIKGIIRKSDFFARWGGEEFIILLPQINLENALYVAEKLRKGIMNYDFKEVKHLTCSFGVTKLCRIDTADKFVSRVDRALYKAKESGRNRVVGIKAPSGPNDETAKP